MEGQTCSPFNCAGASVGLVHFTVGYIRTYAAFVIGLTTGKFGK
jgi:hypothetical protein